MLGICQTETSKAFIMKTGFMGDFLYVVAVVGFCRCRLTVSVGQDPKSGFSGLYHDGPYHLSM